MESSRQGGPRLPVGDRARPGCSRWRLAADPWRPRQLCPSDGILPSGGTRLHVGDRARLGCSRWRLAADPWRPRQLCPSDGILP